MRTNNEIRKHLTTECKYITDGAAIIVVSGKRILLPAGKLMQTLFLKSGIEVFQAASNNMGGRTT
ncbi:hypothetical protein [Chryseobacterium sp. WLY505]|uniref:hypothetical protein n=1 Tax=Chryseobacterium sp. WLY505 TaxID=3068892 RepID=UPI002796BD5E|nr:hypothetical protein [Chryseobacterium sp. WLY505]MDQ1856434.1 hypothetical protein [Chryseobacterium sp. WLY505]